MRERQLAIFWIALAVIFPIALIGFLQYSSSLKTRSATAAAEVSRLRATIAQKELETLAEMKSNASILQEMSWTGTTGDPVAFLSRVADLAEGSKLRVLAVGPLEQQDTPQFSKSWHSVTVQGPFQDLVDLATRVENDRGTLENVSMEAQTPPPPAAPVPGARPAPARPVPEVLARFRVTALQLTQQARRILDDTAKASGVSLAPMGPQAGLSLPVPSAATDSRDPFSFGSAVERPRVVETAAVPQQAFDLQGIVGFPGGHLAILNNQIVKTGDKVSGHSVEQITDTIVLLRQPDGSPRRLSLPEIGASRGARPEPPPAPPGAGGAAPRPSEIAPRPSEIAPRPSEIAPRPLR